MIELYSVKKIYNNKEYKTTALFDVNLQVNRNEMIAVMGTSGSGKTTLLNIIGGIDQLTDGKYLFNGMDIASLNTRKLHEFRKKNISFVFQNFELLDRYTVYENIEIPLIARRLKNRRDTIMNILQYMGIQDLEKARISQISGGEKQRCAIARALVADTSVILADEPTGSLDNKTSMEIMMYLRKINKESNKTIIIVTHDKEVAMQCDRIVYIEDGKIERE